MAIPDITDAPHAHAGASYVRLVAAGRANAGAGAGVGAGVGAGTGTAFFAPILAPDNPAWEAAPPAALARALVSLPLRLPRPTRPAAGGEGDGPAGVDRLVVAILAQEQAHPANMRLPCVCVCGCVCV